MNLRVFMPGASEWLCRYCNEKFWWHPGATEAKRPTECACGRVNGIKEPTLLIKLVPIEEHKGT